MPPEIEALISDLENETADIQKLGGVLVWMEMTVRRGLDRLQQISKFDALESIHAVLLL